MLFHAAFLGAMAGLASAAAAAKGGKGGKNQSSTTAAIPAPACSTTPSGYETSFTATATDAVAQAAATALSSSPTSNVKGAVFDRLAIIIFENTDYNKVLADPNFQFFYEQGIRFSNYHAVCHPSEPNYAAMIGGDYFGMDNDNFNFIDRNVSTLMDLLDDRGVSWGYYQEDMPYTGYEGFDYKNQKSGANDYVRKHNPAILYNSITQDPYRLSLIKNLSLIDIGKSMFHRDLDQNLLPQWMFITPNMTSDAHDTDITTAGIWLREFLEPLMKDKNFMKNTAVLVTFDENGTDNLPNQILSFLLHDKMPKNLKGTVDDNFYTHYSTIASASANWDLRTLGRWDHGANKFWYIAQITGDKLRAWSTTKKFLKHAYNISYAGVFNSGSGNKQYPAPNLKMNDAPFNGRHILQSIVNTWQGSSAPAYYKDTIEVDDGLNPPLGFEPNHGGPQ